MIIAVNFQFKQLERRRLKKKNQGFNRTRTRDLCDTGAMLYRMSSVWSHTLGAWSIYWVHISRKEWNDVKYIWNNSYFYILHIISLLTGDMNSINWPRSQFFLHSSVGRASHRNRTRILLRPDFFRLLLSNCLNWKFTAMIILHLQLQKANWSTPPSKYRAN